MARPIARWVLPCREVRGTRSPSHYEVQGPPGARSDRDAGIVRGRSRTPRATFGRGRTPRRSNGGEPMMARPSQEPSASRGRRANAQTTTGTGGSFLSDRQKRYGTSPPPPPRFARTDALFPQVSTLSTSSPADRTSTLIPSGVKRQKSSGAPCNRMRNGVVTTTYPPAFARSCNVRMARQGSTTCSNTCSHKTMSNCGS
jgi:hypothetical protein